MTRLLGGLPRGQVSELIGPRLVGAHQPGVDLAGGGDAAWRIGGADRHLRSLRSGDGRRRAASICRGCCGCAGRRITKTAGARRSGLAAGRARGRRAGHAARAHDRSRAQGAQSRAAVGRLHGGGARFCRCAARRHSPRAAHHVAAPAADRRRHRHRVSAAGADAARAQRGRGHDQHGGCRQVPAVRGRCASAVRRDGVRVRVADRALGGDRTIGRGVWRGLQVTARVSSPRRTVQGTVALDTMHAPRRVGDRVDAGDAMFACLYSLSAPLAALVKLAEDFTPRFEVVGPLVMLDVSGLSRLFGTPREIGEQLRRAAPGAGAHCHCADANRRRPPGARPPGLTVVAPGEQHAALAPLPVSLLGEFERLRLAAHVRTRRPLPPPRLAPVAPPSHLQSHRAALRRTSRTSDACRTSHRRWCAPPASRVARVVRWRLVASARFAHAPRRRGATLRPAAPVAPHSARCALATARSRPPASLHRLLHLVARATRRWPSTICSRRCGAGA